MTFLSLLAALLLEQSRPLRQGSRIHAAFEHFAAGVEGHFNGGQYRQGAIAWCVALLPLLAVTALVYEVLYDLTPVAAWLWNTAVLYLTMGFRQFSRYFNQVQFALRAGDLATARDWLARWRGEPVAEFGAGELARVAIEHGLLASHRHVFGTIAWFIVLGPAGAILYRASAVLADSWGARADTEGAEFGRFARRVFTWLDWVPARLTAATFAFAGDFEDAIYCWRTQAAAWSERAHGVILASGGGALGVRLGDSLPRGGGTQFRPELGMGDEADADAMQSAAGLTWRSLALWMLLILLVTIAYWTG